LIICSANSKMPLITAIFPHIKTAVNTADLLLPVMLLTAKGVMCNESFDC